MMKAPYFSKLFAFGFELFFFKLRRARLQCIYVLNAPQTSPRPRMGKTSNAIHLEPFSILPDNSPVVLVGNHVSNWDGFLFREIQRRLRPKANIFSLMLEKELKHFSFLRLLGGIGHMPGSPKSLSQHLRNLRSLRAKQSDFFLSVFPQGKIWPSTRRPLAFQSGVKAFVEATSPCVVLPIGLHLEPLRGLKPSVIMVFSKPIIFAGKLAKAPVDEINSGGPENPFSPLASSTYEQEVELCLNKVHELLNTHGEDLETIWSTLPNAEKWAL